MRTINNTYYNFTFNKDRYLLTSKLTTDFSYNLYYVEDGKVDKLLSNKVILGTLDPLEKTDVIAISKDGRYRLELLDVAFPNQVIYFTHSLGKRDLIIRGLRRVICRDCNGCKKCEDKQCLANQSLYNLTNNYLYVNKDFSLVDYPIVSDVTLTFYRRVFNNNYDYLNHQLSMQCLDNMITGSTSTNQDLFSYYMAIYYLGWYLEAKQEIDSLDTESLEFLDRVYEYQKLSDCIRKLGINIEDATDEFNLQPVNVFYWKLGQTETFATLQNLFNSTYLLSKAFQSLTTFQQGYNVSTVGIGKLCFAINNTDNTTVILYDALGNDVTDNFDTFYDVATRSIVFCSKPSYISGTMFFKFKTI